MPNIKGSHRSHPYKIRREYLGKPSKLPGYTQHKIPCSVHPDCDKTASKNVRTCRECAMLYKRLVRKKFGIPAKQEFQSDRACAIRRGLVWELTFEQWSEIISQPCIYGGCQGGLVDLRRGIDRRDNSVGYTLDNSQPCCYRHNRFKSDLLTHEQTLDASARYGIACGNMALRKGNCDNQKKV